MPTQTWGCIIDSEVLKGCQGQDSNLEQLACTLFFFSCFRLFTCIFHGDSWLQSIVVVVPCLTDLIVFDTLIGEHESGQVVSLAFHDLVKIPGHHIQDMGHDPLAPSQEARPEWKGAIAEDSVVAPGHQGQVGSDGLVGQVLSRSSTVDSRLTLCPGWKKIISEFQSHLKCSISHF